MDLRWSNDPPTAAAFKALYDTTGWAEADPDPEFYERALKGSWATCSAYSGERLVGFGRIISDGILHAYINEMIVDPAHQASGIGAAILDRLLARCKAAHITEIQLFCAEGQAEFYRKAGFEPRPASAPGMQFRQVG